MLFVQSVDQELLNSLHTIWKTLLIIHKSEQKGDTCFIITLSTHQKEFLSTWLKSILLAKKEKGIDGDVLVETAEDETHIIAKCEWDVRRDEGWGWCGKEGENHICNPSFVHVVRSDDGVYNTLSRHSKRTGLVPMQELSC